jgi:hypothetical protein
MRWYTPAISAMWEIEMDVEGQQGKKFQQISQARWHAPAVSAPQEAIGRST